jgi:hypothetical protein
MTPLFENRLLTYEEVGEMAQVSKNTVKYWCQTGVMHSEKVGKHPRVWLSEFNRVYKKPDTINPLETLGGKDGKA